MGKRTALLRRDQAAPKHDDAVDLPPPRPIEPTQAVPPAPQPELAPPGHNLATMAIYPTAEPTPAESAPVVQRVAVLSPPPPALPLPPPPAVSPLERVAGLPADLQADLGRTSGLDLGAVRVHYDSPGPAQIDALAYARGDEIFLGPGQEQHLPHEAWHVVQQRQGRVAPTGSLAGQAVNTDASLEHEADQWRSGAAPLAQMVGESAAQPVVQGVFTIKRGKTYQSRDDVYVARGAIRSKIKKLGYGARADAIISALQDLAEEEGPGDEWSWEGVIEHVVSQLPTNSADDGGSDDDQGGGKKRQRPQWSGTEGRLLSGPAQKAPRSQPLFPPQQPPQLGLPGNDDEEEEASSEEDPFQGGLPPVQNTPAPYQPGVGRKAPRPWHELQAIIEQRKAAQLGNQSGSDEEDELSGYDDDVGEMIAIDEEDGKAEINNEEQPELSRPRGGPMRASDITPASYVSPASPAHKPNLPKGAGVGSRLNDGHREWIRRALNNWHARMQVLRGSDKTKRQDEHAHSKPAARAFSELAWVLNMLKTSRTCVALVLKLESDQGPAVIHLYANAGIKGLAGDLERLLALIDTNIEDWQELYDKLYEDVVGGIEKEKSRSKAKVTEAEKTTAKTRLDNAIQLLTVLVAAYNQVQGAEHEMRKSTSKGKHAELRATDAATNAGMRRPANLVTLGISKLCCAKCMLALYALQRAWGITEKNIFANESIFAVPGTHLHGYTSDQPLPDFLKDWNVLQHIFTEEEQATAQEYWDRDPEGFLATVRGWQPPSSSYTQDLPRPSSPYYGSGSGENQSGGTSTTTSNTNAGGLNFGTGLLFEGEEDDYEGEEYEYEGEEADDQGEEYNQNYSGDDPGLGIASLFDDLGPVPISGNVGEQDDYGNDDYYAGENQEGGKDDYQGEAYNDEEEGEEQKASQGASSANLANVDWEELIFNVAAQQNFETTVGAGGLTTYLSVDNAASDDDNCLVFALDTTLGTGQGDNVIQALGERARQDGFGAQGSNYLTTAAIPSIIEGLKRAGVRVIVINSAAAPANEGEFAAEIFNADQEEETVFIVNASDAHFGSATLKPGYRCEVVDDVTVRFVPDEGD